MSNKNKYIDLSLYKRGTTKYVRAVIKKYNLTSLSKARVTIRKRRNKNEYTINLDNSITGYFQRSKDTEYLNSLKIRLSKIITGEYEDTRNSSYKQSYIKMLEVYGVDKKLINAIRNNNITDVQNILPPIKNYYIYISGKRKTSKGKPYRIDINLSDELENGIKESLDILGIKYE